MAPAIALALQLVQFAPSILRYFGVGEENAKVADQISTIAQAATGETTPEGIVAALSANAEQAATFQRMILQNQQDLEKLYYLDVADARKRDAAFLAAGKINVRANWLSALAILVVIGVVAAVWATPNIPEYQKGIATLVLGRFLGYVDQMFNFEFGTTRSSQKQQDTIKSLVGK